MKILLLLLATLLTLSHTCAADSFTYDALNRLTRVAFANGPAINYTYDAMGNLLSTANIVLFTPPGVPTAVTATPGNGSANISFAAPVNNGGDAILSYTVTSTPDGIQGSCSAPCTSMTVNNLTNGTTYTFVATAMNNAGASTVSVASNSVIPVAPVLNYVVSASAGVNGSIAPATQSVIQGKTTSFTVTANAGYTATVSGCGGSLNGSTYTTGIITADCTVSATFLQTNTSIQASLVTGWNLLGNSVNAPMDVVKLFGEQNTVTTVWKWIPASSKWEFYAPSMTAPDLVSYAAAKGYDVLSVINGGEGYWVNAKANFTVALPVGTTVNISSFQDQSDVTLNKLPKGWSLIAVGDNPTPQNFANAIAISQPVSPDVAANSLISLWAWSSESKSWYFYAPSLDNSKGLQAYTALKNYLNFGVKTLDSTTGFWINHP